MTSLYRGLSTLGMALLLLVMHVQAQAMPFSILEAEWSTALQLLNLKGYGEPFATVDVFIAGSDYLLESTTIGGRESWRMRIYHPDQVPCAVDAKSNGVEDIMNVSYAPADCIAAGDTQAGSALVNHPPTISGTPETQATAGELYCFMPTASDPDGNLLEFGISNQPSWATFYSSSGMLSGIPGTQDVGLYSNVVIWVNDGTETTSLDPVDILVSDAPIQSASVSLHWNKPMTRTDGSPLDNTEIGGYKVYMGATDTNLTLLHDIPDSAQTGDLIEDLASGIYYFAVTVYDMNHLESGFSDRVMISVLP